MGHRLGTDTAVAVHQRTAFLGGILWNLLVCGVCVCLSSCYLCLHFPVVLERHRGSRSNGEPSDIIMLCVVVCVQVAGLDVGWHTLLDLQENPHTKRLEVTREVLPGTYTFKFIIDGRWVANHDYPTYLVSDACAPTASRPKASLPHSI